MVSGHEVRLRGLGGAMMRYAVPIDVAIGSAATGAEVVAARLFPVPSRLQPTSWPQALSADFSRRPRPRQMTSHLNPRIHPLPSPLPFLVIAHADQQPPEFCDLLCGEA
jgi:hypothetical protein